MKDSDVQPVESVGAGSEVEVGTSDVFRPDGAPRGVVAKQVSLASFGLAAPLNPQAEEEMSTTRITFYVIGGILVAGGAVAGILALGDDGGGQRIPPPPNRP